jgi:hypothetical protein
MAVKSKRDHENYLMIDNRLAPAIPDELLIPLGFPAGAGRGLFETPTITCHHCQANVVLNPNRSRERAWCKKCDHYLCDQCGVALSQTGICKPFGAVLYEAAIAADKAAQSSASPIILL